MFTPMANPASHEASMEQTTEIRVVFDAPPGRDMPTLVTVEDEHGRYIISGGEWRERRDGYWELVFRTAPMLVGSARSN
jgi:hypothetical protein